MRRGWLGRASLVAVVTMVVVAAQDRPTVLEKLRQEADLSKFSEMLERTPGLKSQLETRQATVFAFTNQALDRYNMQHSQPLEDAAILYHITNQAHSLDHLGASISSELTGNPPLWITKRQGTREPETFINNARILRRRSNYQQRNRNGKEQVLHIVDEVLEPSIIEPSDPTLYNADASQFLRQSTSFQIGEHRVWTFNQRVDNNGKMDVFKADGRNTFFIPVDEGFEQGTRREKIDSKVIDGHVIPNEVLFTRASKKDVEHITLASSDNLKVNIAFSTSQDSKTSKVYVKSNTVVGDFNHTEGGVIVEIVKGNIPVKNGVIHLISQPLMVVDSTVGQFLTGQKDSALYEFYQVIKDYGSPFMDRITTMRDLTLFAPVNNAWNNSNIRKLLGNSHKINEILKLHLVPQRLPTDHIISNNIHSLFQVDTEADRKKLYFNVIGERPNVTLTVEGGGVNATVIEPDIAATNGIVHIIDRVLGVPYTTVFQKLATDPMLNKTFHLGQRQKFNEQLNDSRKQFTYFVPADTAWTKAELHVSSATKKIFMEDFNYHVNQILERHLIVGHSYTMADLKKIARNTTVLPSVRDILKIRVGEIDSEYYIEWQGVRIKVFRPDVECTNGIIHVTDTVMMKESDVTVSGVSSPMAALLIHLVMLLAVKFLL